MCLDPDPDTAPHVRWIFAQRLAGVSIAGIARTLNALGVPSPSTPDSPTRNPTRTKQNQPQTTEARPAVRAAAVQGDVPGTNEPDTHKFWIDGKKEGKYDVFLRAEIVNQPRPWVS